MNRTTYAKISMEEASKDLNQKLYASFINNKDLSYRQFIKKINEENNKNFDYKSLRENIIKTIQPYSPIMAKNMLTILKYSIAKEKGYINTIRELKETIDNMKITPRISPCFGTNRKDSIERNNKIHNKMIGNLNNSIEKSTNKEEDDLNLLTRTKYNLRDIDNDVYINYLTSKYDVKKISLNEISQMYEVVKYFIKHLNNNIELFESYDIVKDEDKIRSLYIAGEEKIINKPYSGIKALYIWKLKKLKSILKKYNELLSSIEEILKTKNVDSFSKVSSDTKRFLKEEGYLYDTYNELEYVCGIYNKNISSLNTVSQKRIDELKKEYNKRFILENNE